MFLLRMHFENNAGSILGRDAVYVSCLTALTEVGELKLGIRPREMDVSQVEYVIEEASTLDRSTIPS